MLQKPMIFTLAQEDSAGEVLAALASWSNLHEESTASHRRVFFDSFDWRLHGIGAQLCLHLADRQAGRLELSGESEDEALVCPWPGRGQPGFARNLPDGPLKGRLESVLEMRRLLPLAEISVQSTLYRWLDKKRKTVARLRFETIRATEKTGREGFDLPPRVVLLPVRGYRKAFSQLLAKLEKQSLAHTQETLQCAALTTFGRHEGDYSGKIETSLRPQQKAGEALLEIFRDLLVTIRANEDGTRKDLDSEFLHDFRVAIRRTRSALSQLKALLPAEACAHFRREFRWLGNSTGPTRDLDVYLLKFPSYQETLPPHVRDHLLPLRKYLLRHQRQEQKKLARLLRCTRYRKLLEDWHGFLEDRLGQASLPADDADLFDLPAVEVACRRLRKASRRVLRAGEQAVRDRSPADELHSLRIDCKKLRYLMEFFRTLYARQEIGGLIRSLKLLQDNLGDFNDFEVQQGALLSHAEKMAEENEVPAQTLMAMGRLVKHLEDGQEEERVRFESCFESFSTSTNRGLMKRLFASKAQTA